MIESATPVLPVDRIEASIEFFSRVGFEKVTEVPEGDHLGFVILMQGSVQIMYQTRTSILEDSGMLAGEGEGAPVLLFLKQMIWTPARRRWRAMILPCRSAQLSMARVKLATGNPAATSSPSPNSPMRQGPDQP